MSKTKPSGCPVKNVIKPIPDTPQKLAKAIFRAADKKIATSTEKKGRA